MNDAFLDVLAGCTDACANIDLSDDAWKPPPGDYDVRIDGVQTGTKEKNGITFAWIKPAFVVLDGEFEGRMFTDYYWIEPGSDKPSMSLRNFLRFATCLRGSEVRDPVEAVAIAEGAEGDFLTVQVFQTTSRKTSQVYTNIRFLQRLDAVAAPEDAATPTTA